MGEPSQHAKDQIGKEITWRRSAPRPREAVGICIGVERIPGMTVSTDDGTYPAVRFQIRDKNTGRRVWTDAFADVGP